MKKYVAEFIGTFVLVFVSCGAAAVSGGIGGFLGIFGIAAAFGLSIVAMAYCIGNISGCHINPAVSLAMLISKRMSVADFFGYIISQFIGGIAAAASLKAISNCYDENVMANFETSYNMDLTSLGTNGYGAESLLGISMVGALVVEVILTFIFVLTVLGVTSKPEFSKVAGLVIGGALTFVHLIGIPLTGTSVNPARSFGPALLTGGVALKQVWVFIAAPLVGGVLAALVWMFLTYEKKAIEVEESDSEDVVEEAAEEAVEAVEAE